jgi:predicted O-linked N-acetylglucosamine transferase (SPINDLY family)
MDPRFNAAEAALKAGKSDEAIALLKQALEQGPGPIGAYRVLVNHLMRRTDYVEAERWARAATEALPKEFEGWNLLGVALRRLRRYPEALAALERAQKLNSKSLMPLINKGNVLNDMGEGKRAAEVYTLLIRHQPNVPEHHRNLALAYRHLGEMQKAASRLDLALRLNPQYVDAWLDRISLATGMQHHEEALEIAERALLAVPGHRRLLETRIIVLRRAGRHGDAEGLLQDVIAAEPNAAWAHFQLARTICDHNRPRANDHFRRAVEIEPNNITYRLGLAESLDRSRFGDEGANIQEAYEQLTEIRKLGVIPPEQMNMARQIYQRVGAYDEVAKFGDFAEVGRRWALAGNHAAFLQHLGRVSKPEDRHELIHQHRLWGDTVQKHARHLPIQRRPRPRTNDKIRLGLLSSDLRNHPVAYFALPLFEHIDRERFEVYCYSFSQGPEDDTQKFITGQVDAFRWNKKMSDRDAAQMIADDDLDLLIELGGSTHMNKLEVMAYKPAPLQASWLGYPHSAGLTTIDYLVVDPYMLPTDPKLIIEKPMIMPHTWLALGSRQFREEPQVALEAPQERNGFITFGTANNPHKYGPGMLSTWAKIVAATPDSQFMFVRPEGGTKAFRELMTAAFEAEGVSADRVRFEAVRGRHLPFYNEMDIALDTFPLTGGTTTCETLWMGVPVVSLRGEALFERLSYSLLTNAGLGDLVSETVEGYIANALKLVEDLPRRRQLRATLRDQLKASPLGQTEQFARDFYDLVYRTVRQERAAGGKAKAAAV